MTEGDGLKQIRDLISGPEAQQIHELRERLDDLVRQARDVSTVLPEALALRSRDPAISKALAPAVEDAMTASVRANPRALADALFPVMGPAIRKSLAHTLAGMLESLNRALDRSLSIESLSWRLEAMRSGKAFSEIVMLHTVLFRVEQAFLIHRETGLLLHHVAAGQTVVQDADMVSGMLTAIRDYVHDSFGASGESVESMQVGEFNVWVVPGPRAMLAVVIRGTAPREFRNTLEEAIENIHLRFGADLEAFQGDAAPFVAAEPFLETCLVEQYREKEKKVSPALRAVLLGALLLLGWWTVAWYRESHRWNEYIGKLAAEPGVIVVSAERGWFRHSVTGLRDPLASDPEELLSQSGLNPDEVSSHWEPYQALVPKFVLLRAKILLQPPAGASLSLQNSVLYVTGPLDSQWIADNSRLATALGGVVALRRGESLDAALDRLRPTIEGVRIRFPANSAQASPEEAAKAEKLGAPIREVAAAAVTAGRLVRVEILGFADPSGGSDFNKQLSQQRAEHVRDMISKDAIPGAEFVALGQGILTTAAGPSAEKRQVAIRLNVSGRKP